MDAAEIFPALLTAEGRADPYPLYAALHEFGEGQSQWTGPRSCLAITLPTRCCEIQCSGSRTQPDMTRSCRAGGITRR